jgi:hypothetical protein
MAVSFVFLATAGAAMAADLQPYTKAPPPPPADATSDIHGFFDVGLLNDYLTTRGLLVHNTGLASQISAGLAADVYKNKNGAINAVTVYGGVWTDLWSEQNNPRVGSLNEFDWWVGGKVQFAQNWTIDGTYIEFLSPPGNFAIERNLTATLSYDDTSWGFPVQLKPYIKGWYEASGNSNVTTGKVPSGYVEFGAVPTLDLTKKGLGVIFTAPTRVSVGPKDYWTASAATVCGTIATPCGTSNAGVFSTGLTATVPVTWIPKSYGNWAVRGGFQYNRLLNDYLLQGQVNTGTATSFATAQRDIVVGFAGIGFNF